MKKLIWLAVDSNGDEKISSNQKGFQRFSPEKYRKGDKEECKKVVSFNDTIQEHDIWVELIDYGGIKLPNWIFLPKGSIEKLIGKKLTWDDEPVKIEDNPDYEKIAMYDCHTCANYQTKCDPENGEYECKNPPFTSMYDDEKLPFPRVNEFEDGSSYRH